MTQIDRFIPSFIYLEGVSMQRKLFIFTLVIYMYVVKDKGNQFYITYR